MKVLYFQLFLLPLHFRALCNPPLHHPVQGVDGEGQGPGGGKLHSFHAGHDWDPGDERMKHDGLTWHSVANRHESKLRCKKIRDLDDEGDAGEDVHKLEKVSLIVISCLYSLLFICRRGTCAADWLGLSSTGSEKQNRNWCWESCCGPHIKRGRRRLRENLRSF